jgi:hypothetical protein
VIVYDVSPVDEEHAMNHDKTVSTLNSLLRGEIAATETYQQAMAGASSEAELQRIHEDHRDAANELRKHVHHHGGKPDQGSGPWGVFAKTVEGAANALGHTAALKALKEGEEQGISDYESALNDPDLAEEERTFIRNTLLPRCRSHLSTLDRLMSAPNRS